MKFLPHIVIISFSLLFFTVINSPYKLGVFPDSIIYLEVAENIFEGKGIYSNEGKFIQHWPPLYPLAIAAVKKLCPFDFETSALILNAILFLISVFTFFKIIKSVSQKNGIAFLFSFLLIISKFIVNFNFILSEGLFLTIFLISLFNFKLWIDNRLIKHFWLASFSCALLLLSRYAAVGVIGGYLAYLLLFYDENLKEKIRFFFKFLLPTVIVFGFWIYYVKTYSSQTELRDFQVHLIPLSKLINIPKHILNWYAVSKDVLIIVFIFILSLFLFSKKRLKLHINSIYSALKQQSHLTKLCLAIIFSYILFLIISISFFDAATPINNRILSPIFPITLIILFIILIKNYTNKKQPNIFNIIFLILLFIGIFYNSFSTLKNHYNKGSGYSNKQWKESSLLNYLQTHPELYIYTNGPDIVRYKTNCSSTYIPIKYYYHNTISKTYNVDIEKMITKMRNSKVLVVYFYNIKRTSLIENKELLNLLKNKKVTYFKDGYTIAATKNN